MHSTPTDHVTREFRNDPPFSHNVLLLTFTSFWPFTSYQPPNGCPMTASSVNFTFSIHTRLKLQEKHLNMIFVTICYVLHLLSPGFYVWLTSHMKTCKCAQLHNGFSGELLCKYFLFDKPWNTNRDWLRYDEEKIVMFCAVCCSHTNHQQAWLPIMAICSFVGDSTNVRL